MDKQKAMIFFFIVIIVPAVYFVPKEYAFITSKKINGVISSDGYTKEFAQIFSKNSRYYYTVEYEVDGKKYTSEKYKRSNGRLQKGDIVTIYYKSSDPAKVVESTFPIIGLSLLILAILGIKALKK